MQHENVPSCCSEAWYWWIAHSDFANILSMVKQLLGLFFKAFRLTLAFYSRQCRYWQTHLVAWGFMGIFSSFFHFMATILHINVLLDTAKKLFSYSVNGVKQKRFSFWIIFFLTPLADICSRFNQKFFF